jgi:hypothetical protein
MLAGIAVAAGLIALIDLHLLLQAYLAALLGWSAIPIGALALTMLHRLTGGRWGEVLAGTLAAARCTLPFTALLFLPVALGVPLLYPWA